MSKQFTFINCKVSDSSDTYSPQSDELDYEQAFDSSDRIALVKVLSLYCTPYKYIKMISDIYK